MIELPSFYILTINGESILPDSIRLKRATDHNRSILFYLDANLCLDIADYFNNKLPASSRLRINVETLILFCQQHSIEIVPKFGAMELCKENLQQLNLSKYQDFVNKITYVFDTPFNKDTQFDKLAFNYYTEVTRMDIEALEKFFPLLFLSYISLLKIYVLCKKNNPGKHNVLKNLKLFLHWCGKYLNTSMASEILLAIKIFGGDSKFRKMINLDKKGNVNYILASLWGTAWDFFHMRMVHFWAINSGVDYDLYLITRDTNMFTLFKTCQLHGALSAFGSPIASFVSHDIDISYKEEFILEGIKEILDEFSLKRSINKNLSDQLDINLLYSLKAKLEADITTLVG